MTGVDALKLVQAAARRTLERETARVGFTRFDDLEGAPEGGWISRLLARGLSRSPDEPTRWRVDGAIDFAGGRSMLAGRRKSALVVGEREWHGHPGTPVADAKQLAATSFQPVWVADLLRGLTFLS